MTEEWRPIPGFDRYEVSDSGRVRSSHRKPGHVLRAAKNIRNGYRYVSILPTGETKARSMHVHRLVLLAFVGPLPAGMHTRHLDGDTENNSLGNLTYGTAVENAADRVRHGTASHLRGPYPIHGRQSGEMTVAEAADALHYSPTNVTKLVRTGRLTARQVGRRWLVDGDAVANWTYPRVGRPRKEMAA